MFEKVDMACEYATIPRGVVCLLVDDDEVHGLLLEAMTTKNTVGVGNVRTVEDP